MSSLSLEPKNFLLDLRTRGRLGWADFVDSGWDIVDEELAMVLELPDGSTIDLDLSLDCL